MKTISPSTLSHLNHEPEFMKIFKTGISFNSSAQKLLALKEKDRFILCQDEKGSLYFQETTQKDSFEIRQELKRGGCRCSQKHLLEFLFPEQKNPSMTFVIGEPREGRRLLTPVGFKS
jgi:hypothetical protein